MLLEAILGIAVISVFFCCCTFFCVVIYHFIFTEEKSDATAGTDAEPWKARYDPLPEGTPSPPDTLFKTTPYTFRLQNGNGVYPLPHVEINPAVLQVPAPVFDQQRVSSRLPPSKLQPTRHSRTDREPIKKQNSIMRRSRSRSPSPCPRGAKNVWTTNTDFQNPNNYYQQYYYQQQRHNFYNQQQPQQQNPHQPQEFQRQYVQLTQEHYPVQQKHIRFQPEEYLRHQEDKENNGSHQLAQYEPFMASSHATNVYTQQQHHSPHRKSNKIHHSKSKSRHKEAVI